MTRFDTDTAVTLTATGRYSANLDDGWWIATGPNGGYLAAVLMNALTHAVDDPARICRSFTVHFLSRAVAGLVDIEVVVERSGRSVTSLSARLVQEERVIATVLSAFSTSRPGPSFSDPVMPVIAPPEELDMPVFDSSLPPTAIPEMVRRYEQRWAVGHRPFTGGEVAHTGGWIRLAEMRSVNEALLAAYTDAWMPAMFSRVAGAWGITTVDLTVHIRSMPPVGYDDWCLVHFRSVMSADGFCEEDGEIWTRDGQLLAQSRQLAAIVTVR
jgi:acyl-CoA thioesterase